ncbi:MAG TPA: HlyD family type I secretion periplasmic adaptor subunit [Desulfuromonadales bacterium]|nr:HlyD family type I secretion periplasmic adaptor subunit [Desulfuromonadales bacterium]
MSDFPVSKDVIYNPSHSPRPIIAAGMAIIIIFLGSFALWAALAPLGAAVQAEGDFIFDTKRKTVQHLEGGIVKKIMVREGETVKAGQVLIVLEDEQVRPTVDLLEEQYLAESAALARLDAERNDVSTIQFPATIMARAKEPAVARIIQTETQLFRARRDAYQSQVEVLRNQIEQTKEETAGLKDQLMQKKQEIASIDEQLVANRHLLKKDYVPKTVVLELERMQAEKSGERDMAAASIARNMQRIAEYESRIINLKDTRIQDSATEMKLSAVKRVELEERVRPSRNALERQFIRAPVGGKVVDLKVTTVGGVIAGKEPLMDIVPGAENLVLNAKIGVNDVNDVRVGLPAEITLTAYKASTTPRVKATVTYVSADRLTTKTAQGETPYYEVRLDVDPQSLKEAGNLQLYPGMAAHVSISTKPRTAFDYFIGPFRERTRKAFHER